MTQLLASLPSPVPFDRITADQIEPAIKLLLADAQAALDAIAEDGELSYASTFAALELATEPLETAMGVVQHLESVKSSPELRDAYNAVLPSVSDFWSSISLHAGVYAVLKRFAATDEARTLDPTRARLVQKTLEDFQRHGAELDEPGKEALRALDRELSQVTTKFSQNVLDGTNAFELLVDEARIAGLPESALGAAKESAEKAGKSGYRFTLQAPSVIAVLSHADDAALREELWRAFNRRGMSAGEGNIPLVAKIVELRQAKAQLLGFENFADLVTQDRMAKTGAEASRFVRQLRDRTEEAFKAEQAELLAFRRQLEGPEAAELAPWDVGYYAEKQRQALYDFDEEQLRPYFSADRVLKGAFDLAEALYGVKVEDADLPVWHESVRAHRLLSAEGKVLGIFYTDLFPREEKRDGAWMHGLIAAVPPAPHLALFCANSQPPTKDLPSLMSFREVETVFHEFGHLLHHCLSEVSVRSLACTRVAQDFVELPSQILENWCSEKGALDRFAAHYETGEQIPPHLVERLLAARNFRAASAQMRQLGFAAVDLALHVDYAPTRDGDLLAYANEILAQYAPTPLPSDYAMIASFGHLFSHSVGYAAGYYSYKWAEVLDADAFSRFKQEGLFNRDTGEAFRASILSRGDSADPMALFEEFMGRAPELEPMLARQGLGTGA